MAQNIWQASTGDWDTGSNWSDTAKPDATDDIVIPATTTQAITSNCDNENAIDCVSILIQAGHNQDIGSSGVPLYISTGELIHNGGGTLYFKAGDAKIDRTVIDASPSAAGTKSASLTGDAAAADYGEIQVVRGDVDIEGVTFTIDLLMVGAVGSGSTIKLDVKAANGAITDMHVASGLVYLNRPVTRLTVAGGRVIIDNYKPTTVYQTGGVVEYKTPTSVGDITTYYLKGGFLDLTQSYWPKGITTLIVDGSARYLKDRNTTITNEEDYRRAA
jgi:hypothetical protein